MPIIRGYLRLVEARTEWPEKKMAENVLVRKDGGG